MRINSTDFLRSKLTCYPVNLVRAAEASYASDAPQHCVQADDAGDPVAVLA
jgi:hypothetical protein